MTQQTHSTHSTGSGSSTSLVLPERVPALAAIYADLIRLAANMMNERVKGGKKMTFAERRSFIEERTIWSVNALGEAVVGVPFVAHVSFGGESQRVGWTLEKETNAQGESIFNESGEPEFKCVADHDLVISGKVSLPDPQKLTERISCEVRPLRTTNGLGSLIEYVVIDEMTGAMRAGEPMLCIFIRDFDPYTGIENGRVRAVPLGLARVETIGRWNTVVARMVAQNPNNAWQQVMPIVNSIGRAIEYLELQPQGAKSMLGLSPVYKPSPGEKIDKDKWAYTIVARLGGKIAELGKKSGLIIFKGEVAENQLFLVEEMWNKVILTVWGLPGEVKSLDMKELDLGEAKVDALALLGASLYDVHPGSGGALVGRAIMNPPIDYMIGNGWLTPGTTEDVGRITLQGMGRLLRERVREQVNEARRDIIHALGAAGTETEKKPMLAEILRGVKTPEALRDAMNQNKDECPLAAWMLTSTTVANLGLVTWDWNCWVLKESRRDLLMELARSQGLELPPPKPPEEKEVAPQSFLVRHSLGDGGSLGAPVSAAEAGTEKPATDGNIRLPQRARKPRSRKAKTEGNGATT